MGNLKTKIIRYLKKYMTDKLNLKFTSFIKEQKGNENELKIIGNN
jgi:hypothetical protein